MPRSQPGRGGPDLLVAAFLVAVVLAAGCNPVDLTAGSSARVRVETTGGASVLLVTSSDFFVAVDPAGALQVELFSADTSWHAPPPAFDRTFDIRNTKRFLVRALATEPAGASVLMRVWIDGDERHSANQILSERILEFIFVGR